MIRALTFTPDDRILWENIVKDNSIKSPFASFDWHETWMQTIGRDYTPLYLIINNKTISPFVLHENIIEFAGFHVTDYCDLIGPESAKESAWKEIVDYLSQHSYQEYFLRNIPETSSTLAFFRRESQLHVSILESAPILPLASTYEKYLTQLVPDHRRKLLSGLRKFIALNQDSIVIESNKSESDIDLFISLMRKNPNKDRFLTKEREMFFRSLIYSSGSNTHLLFLKINDTAVAGRINFHEGTTLYFYNSGFDRENYPLAGFYLLTQSIKQAIHDGVQVIHLLRGNEPYKYRLGAKDFQLYEISGTITST